MSRIFFLVIFSALACEPTMRDPAMCNPEAGESGCIVRIEPIDESGEYCTGVVIGEREVITAAHCVKPGTIYRVSSATGRYIGRSIRAVAHPDYKRGERYDVALITTPSDLGVQIADVDTRDPRDLIGTDVYWSGIDGGGPGLVIGFVRDDSDLIVDESFSSVTCSGDSGSGVFSNGELVAVNSRGGKYDGECLPHNAVYTAIAGSIDRLF